MTEKTDRKKVLALIDAERTNQIKVGYDESHDDEHVNGEIAQAASAILSNDVTMWPWDRETFDRLNSKSHMNRLVIAGAFVAAEAQRIMRFERKIAKDARDSAISAAVDATNFVDYIDDLKELDRIVKKRLKFLAKEEKKEKKKKK